MAPDDWLYATPSPPRQAEPRATGSPTLPQIPAR